MANAIQFSRGDGVHHKFLIPEDSWNAGGHLFFAAKASIDDDNTDASAVIEGDWDDTSLLADEVIDGVNHKVYDCYFPPSATSGIASNGELSAEYLGEYQWVPLSGDPITFPPDEPKLTVIVYFDVNRRTTA